MTDLTVDDKFILESVFGSRKIVTAAKSIIVTLEGQGCLCLTADNGKMMIVGRKAFAMLFCHEDDEYFDALVSRLLNGEDEIILDS